MTESNRTPAASSAESAGLPSRIVSTAVAHHTRELLGGSGTYTISQLAQEAGTNLSFARNFWRAMGFADVTDTDRCFTDADVEALRTTVAMTEGSSRNVQSADLLSDEATTEILRAHSYTMDRLVLWEWETFVLDLARRLDLDDTSARLVAMDHMGSILPMLSQQLTYAWKRHLVALLDRTDAEVSQRGREDAGPDLYPLTRSLGFVDIVSFTQRAQSMGRHDLSLMLDDFEHTARNVVTSRGARVVKTIGDAVMYIADDLTTAADVVTSLVEELQSGPTTLRVRASLVEGRVVSRSGDVFGPTVNLASRLVDTAEPGGVAMDEATAQALLASDVAGLYRLTRQPEVVAKGLGQISPWSLERR